MNSKLKFLVALLSLMLLTLICYVIVNAYMAWAPDTAYAVHAMTTYNGIDYKCLHAHTSQVGWEPPNAPVLWRPVGPKTTSTATNTNTQTPTPSNGVTATATNTNTPSYPNESPPGGTRTPTPTNTNTPTA